MRLNDLVPAKGSNKKRKRLGRGQSSGHGKTSCRGHKGQKSRTGKKLRPGFEGGQMPLSRRIPKRGFNNPGATTYQIVNVEKLNRFKKESSITTEMLKSKDLIKDELLPVKVLGTGKISKALNIQVQAISKQAKGKIEKSAGKVELIRKVKAKD